MRTEHELVGDAVVLVGNRDARVLQSGQAAGPLAASSSGPGAASPVDVTVRLWAGLGALGALEFLERSRDVASELVVNVAGDDATLSPSLLHW